MVHRENRVGATENMIGVRKHIIIVMRFLYNKQY